ncbi:MULTISPECIES: hypothetical protein [unclassified Nodularia (in: cyanobacteria)]|uniref:hypothetical protein n=1 Tax=unclassified Nodularia (in: cyanobacteria) TaxID=2656917 RepID=UPI001880C5A0|nr:MULTISPECIES: hypothetical protein [unclassified Nodularia (in: cyanobacteria)]MBE9197690.1 hypothetical protein [Nodularia sp. LEGE 06071]MCC2694016.1 hypothetical protein [Nodularia sp. LEGE 04288]
MFKLKFILLITASLILISGFTITQVIQAENHNLLRSASLKETETELVSIAEAALKTDNDILVNGNIPAALNRHPRSARATVALKTRFEKTLERRNFLAARKIGFSGFQTKLEVKNIQINGDTATLEAIEKTVRNYDLAVMAPDAPQTTESHIDHLFTFVLRNGEWELLSDQLLNLPGPPSKPDAQSVPVDPSVTPADPL